MRPTGELTPGEARSVRSALAVAAVFIVVGALAEAEWGHDLGMFCVGGVGNLLALAIRMRDRPGWLRGALHHPDP